MGVYVDKGLAPYKGMLMSHMVADTRKELMDMARRIKLNLRWIQSSNTYKEHFDLCQAKRREAIRMGATVIGSGDLARSLRDKRGHLCDE